MVRIHADEFGSLGNQMRFGESCEPLSLGISALMKNLSDRKLL